MNYVEGTSKNLIDIRGVHSGLDLFNSFKKYPKTSSGSPLKRRITIVNLLKDGGTTFFFVI